MKNQLFLLFLSTFVFSGTLSAQCPNNTPLGSTINEFDWTTETFQMFIIEDDGDEIEREVASPFHLVNGEYHANTLHLAYVSQLPDYQVEDGWELLYVNFGTPQHYVAEPSFTLYNRFNALVRAFFYITAAETVAFNSAVLEVEQLLVTKKNSALLENLNSPMNALNKKKKRLKVQRHNEYNEMVGSWIIAEFAAAYDPCTCYHTTAIGFHPILTTSVSQLDMTIDGSSIVTPIVSNGRVTSNNNGFIEAIGGINEGF